MVKFLRFSASVFGLDLLLNLIIRLHEDGAYLRFFKNLGFTIMFLIIFHFIGLILMGSLEPKFYTDYGNYISNIRSTGINEIAAVFFLVTASGITLTMFLGIALFLVIIILSMLIILPYGFCVWCKKKWREVYGTPENEDECEIEDDD